MGNFGTYLKTKQFRINLFLAFFAVFAVILIAFYSLGAYTRHGSGIPVPELKGLAVEKAMGLLKEQGFEYKIDSVYVLDRDPGSVIEQDPDPGTNAKEGRTIYLTVVTRLAPPVALPDLEPYTYREALSVISNYGLKVGDTIYKYDIARDRILEVRFAGQPIKPGAKIPKGSRLDLVLGNGEGASEVEIPDLVNQDLDAAKMVIKQSGVILGTITYQGQITDSTSVTVIAQSPMKTDTSGKVSNGTKINLTVSQTKKETAPSLQP